RVLLGEGVLTKECRKKAKPRVFFLFNDILVYGSIVLSKRKYRRQHIIPLEEVTLEPLPETLEAKNRWMIKTAKKSFVVSAASTTDGDDDDSDDDREGSGDGDWPSQVEFYTSGVSWSAFHS
ncbi:pleckstrin homology domain-containing family F member 1, partial [Cricetulus griseus]|uniref:pleckstrin homology domain-containing family F member 1 n=1 Tax=Cricetulus griseus TaxID=10029 RepID=UPI00022F602D